MSAPKPPIDREGIRVLVRQVLRDALPEAVRERLAAESAKAAAIPAPKAKKSEVAAHVDESDAARIEEVSIATDAELNVFVRRLLALEPKQRDAVLAGRLRFRLKRVRNPAEPESTARNSCERIDKGIVNERKILASAKAGKALVLGRGVVVTPLARDKARQLGVQIERE